MQAGNGAARAYLWEQKRNTQAAQKGWVSERLVFSGAPLCSFYRRKASGAPVFSLPILAAGPAAVVCRVCDGCRATATCLAKINNNCIAGRKKKKKKLYIFPLQGTTSVSCVLETGLLCGAFPSSCLSFPAVPLAMPQRELMGDVAGSRWVAMAGELATISAAGRASGFLRGPRLRGELRPAAGPRPAHLGSAAGKATPLPA